MGEAGAPLSRAAAIALVAWMILALAVGEVFPFSRFAMYAAPPNGPTAIPVFQADGVDADPARFRGFTGLPRGSSPPPAPSTTGYVADRIRHTIETSRGEVPGPVRVAVGWRVLTPGAPPGPFLVTGEGTAWPR